MRSATDNIITPGVSEGLRAAQVAASFPLQMEVPGEVCDKKLAE